jgi:L-ascorbate metabolism protein UlaG (beta-lactamase superfamily)
MRFANLDPAHRPHSRSAVFRWMVLDRLRGRRRVQPAGDPAPRVAPELDRIHSNAPTTRLTWIGHSSFLCTLGERHLAIDPVFARRIARFVRRHGEPGLRAAELPGLSCLLISHNHYDHLDRPSLRAIAADVPAVVPAGMGRWFRRWHRQRRVIELDWWQSTEVNGLEITLVPARHWSRRGIFDVNRQHWGGFVVHREGATLYHAGDSAWFGGFAEIARRFPSIDVAMLPIGAYQPPWFMEQQHMNPEQALAAFEALGCRWMVPMHWGTFQLTDEPISEPATRLRRAWSARPLAERRLVSLAVGETLELDRELRRIGDRSP